MFMEFRRGISKKNADNVIVGALWCTD